MPPKNSTVHVNDVAGRRRPRNQTLDHLSIVSGRHKADVLTIGLLGIRQAKFVRQFAHARLRHAS